MTSKLPYSSLHTHTSFSVQDGASKRSDVIKKAKEFGMRGLAITEHGNMFGAISFYKECLETGIVPCIGMEAYVSPDTRFGREYAKKGEAEENAKNGDLSMYAYHLTILTKNREGYDNLKNLSSLAFREGFYRKPRIDEELLVKYNKGLIILSGCLASKTSRLIIAGNETKALEEIDKMRAIFGEDFFLEVMDHNISEEALVREALIDFGKRRGIGMVMTGDSHYTNPGDELAHEATLAMGTGKTLSSPDRWKFNGEGYWFKSPEEIAAIAELADIPDEAVSNSDMIISRVEDYGFKLASKTKKSIIPIFKDNTGKPLTSEECNNLIELKCREGMMLRGKNNIKEYEDRLTHELETIKNKDFSSYFLLIADIVDFMRNNNIMPPYGRGSSVGSLVCYCLYITGGDPIKFNIPFSRFINEGRKDLPDIDTDISQARRKEVLDYIVKKYGADRVGQIITFQAMGPKAVVDNVGRVLDVPSTIRRQLGKLIGDTEKDDHLVDILKDQPKVAEIMKTVPNWIDIANSLEGNAKNTSAHAAGIVISNEPLMDHVPLARDTKDGYLLTQYDMKELSELGLLKLDMLGLKTMDLIQYTIELIKERQGVSLDFQDIPTNDDATYKTIAGGKFVSVFQFDSNGIRTAARQLKPEIFDHIIALNALYRPGPMLPDETGKSIMDRYIDRRHGREEVEVWHQDLEPVFRATYGVCLFQEELMQMSRVIAGFTESEADEFRSAVGKKNKVAFQAAIDKFITRGVEFGRDREFMVTLSDRLEGFARYAWNIGHSLAYGYLSYVTAYLETHYPLEYFTTLLNVNLNDNDNLKVLLANILQKGVKISPPDINHSGKKFHTDGKQIYMGIYSIKKIGDAALNPIMAVRDQTKFDDFIDFCIKTSKSAGMINKTVKENLIKAGAFNFDQSLIYMDKINNIELIHKIIKKFADKVDSIELRKLILERLVLSPPGTALAEQTRLANEREVLNFYISGHPVLEFQALFSLFDQYNFTIPSQIAATDIGTRVLMVGILESKEMKTTKNGKPYINMVVGDHISSRYMKVWSPLSTAVFNHLPPDNLILINGIVKEDNYAPDDNQVSIDHILAITPTSGGIPIKEFLADSEEVAREVISIIDAKEGSISEGILQAGHVVTLKETAYLRIHHFDQLKKLTGKVHYAIAFPK